MEEVKETKQKKRIMPFIIIMWIVVLGMSFSYFSILNHRNNKEKQAKVTYCNMVRAYGDAIKTAAQKYIADNDGQVPTLEDLEDDLIGFKDRIYCSTTINDNGTVHLENCNVIGIDNPDPFCTYGMIIEKPTISTGELYIYKVDIQDDKSYYVIYNYENNNGNYELVKRYKCQSKDCKGYYIKKEKSQALIYDNNRYYYYNYENDRKTIVNAGTEKYLNINIIGTDDTDYGLSLMNGEKTAIYSFEKDEIITDFIYSNVSTYDVDELLKNGYFAASIYDEDTKINTLQIIDIKDGSIKKTFDNQVAIRSTIVGDKVLYFTTSSMIDSIAQIYNADFTPLIDEKTDCYYAINSDDTLSVYKNDDNTMFYVYDNEGKLIFTSKKYKQIIKVFKDYIAVLDDDNNLKLYDKEENEVANFLKVTDNYKLHPMISGWHTENGKNGIYMVLEDTSLSYGTEGAGLEYYYIPTTKEAGVIKTDGVGGYAKPVMYFYPTEKTKINVTFTRPEVLTTTYPKYENNWTFTAYPNGDLYDENNKYYYGMYWEELGSSKIDFSEGFYVTKENAIEFLEETTKKIGFTRREANEFIMYWLKILENNEKSLVYYELTESRNNYNNVIINPKPDSMLRVSIHVKKVDKYTKIKEQKLPTFKRIGFTVVEWGGVEH